MAYNMDFKKRAIANHQEGHTQNEVSAVFDIHTATIREWEARLAAGKLEPEYPKTRKPRKLPPDELKRYYEENPDAFLEEAGAHFGCSAEAVRKALKKHKITRKKKR